MIFFSSEGLSLLGAYEDSDEEDGVDSQISAPKTKINQSADIDSTLANFMAVSIVAAFIYWSRKTPQGKLNGKTTSVPLPCFHSLVLGFIA